MTWWTKGSGNSSWWTSQNNSAKPSRSTSNDSRPRCCYYCTFNSGKRCDKYGDDLPWQDADALFNSGKNCPYYIDVSNT